jgi:transcriptional regulator with XRE-family HTH domain
VSNVQQARQALGRRLRELRRSAGLNGKQLARMLDWQATKVSKIEHGKQTPSREDILAWTAATGTDDQAELLIAQVRHLDEAYAEWRRQLRIGLQAIQRKFGELEASSRLIRNFEAAAIPGLLQTPAYARCILSQSVRVHQVARDLDEGVAARMERQGILYQPGRRFHFIITEAALRYRPGPPEVLMGQIERLLVSATLPSVALGVIPFETVYPKYPVHGFWIFDERLVAVETFAAELSLIQPEEIALYGKVFALMHEVAVYGRQAREVMTRVLEDLGPHPEQ